MEDILRLNRCPAHLNQINLSLDGVQESKSSNISTDVYSITFKNCQKVYPIKLIRPINKYRPDNQSHFQDLLDDINLNLTKINNIICDNPKRSFVKMVMNSNAKFGCDYCEAPAIHVNDLKKIQEIKKKFELLKQNVTSQIQLMEENPGPSSNLQKVNSMRKALEALDIDLKSELKKHTSTHLCWPNSTSNGELRTVEKATEIVNLIETADHPLERDVTKGILGKSLVLELKGFNYITNVPAEYMHCTCLGVVKRLVELTFKVGQVRFRNTKRKLSDPKKFNELIRNVQLPFECSRRCRNLDFAVLKASEFRNIIIFFFTIVVKCIEKEFVKERRLWLQLAYTIRACVLSNEEFDNISKNTITSLCMSFYKNYESTYGPKNCTYSVHIVACHILLIRGDEPLTARSAFAFENFYAEMRNLFCPGTLAPLKQIFRNCIVKRLLESHHCMNSIKYSKMPSPEKIKLGKENNHSVYIYNQEDGHTMYNIIGDNEDNTFTCIKQGKFECEFEELKNLKWSKVGVYKLGPTCSQPVRVQKSDIAGKVIHVDNYLITCPNNVLREK